MTALLEVSNLSAGYGAVRAVRNLTVSVDRGEFVVLLGPNGAGKTTTLKTISGLLNARTGSVTFNGENITRLADWRRLGRGIGHVPEGRQIFGEQTVEENLLLGAFLHRRSQSKINALRDEMYDLFPRLRDRRKQEAGTLSGGEAQMLAIARALMGAPSLLMLDEPSLGLAPLKVAEMFGYLSRLHKEQGLAILLVEQQASTALKLADRGYVLELGDVVLEGSARELEADPRMQEVYLGEA